MRFVSLIACGVLAASSASATVLATTAIYVPSGNSPDCQATNLGNKAVDVNIRIVGLTGEDLVANKTPLAPGATSGISTSASFSGWARCQFEFNGSRKAVRAALLIEDNASGLPVATLVAQ